MRQHRRPGPSTKPPDDLARAMLVTKISCLATWAFSVLGVVGAIMASEWWVILWAFNAAICAAGWWLAVQQWAAWKFLALQTMQLLENEERRHG